MIKQLFLVLLSLTAITALPSEDLVSAPPGMIGAVIYSGYLKTPTQGRKIHYVFVQANVTDPSTVPLTVWLNGGPGCSSLCGMIQQIGPYLVGNDYKLGDMLTKNQYSWDRASNMLFLQSPAIVGFSTETDKKYQWTDEETAKDAFSAISDFIFTKAPQFANRSFFITGESYAGKYVPDIADLILTNNRNPAAKYINLKGIMVGNGVMNFQNNQLQKSEIQYMIDHSLVSNRLQYVYEHSCIRDYDSPRCKFVRFQMDTLQAYLNPYDIYETCKNNYAEGLRLRQATSAIKNYRKNGKIYQKEDRMLGEIPDCPTDDGAILYWNLNRIAYKTDKVNKAWQVCGDLNYAITERGSMQEYRRIFLNQGVRVWLFNGDWDDVVPYVDTEKNVNNFHREKVGEWSSWNVGDQHAGFYQQYVKNFTVITVKGAGHMVPVTKPKPMYQLFYNFINGKGVNNQVF